MAFLRGKGVKKMNKTSKKERLTNYKTRLDLYIKAETAILEGAQSYSIGSRNLTRANLSEIRKMISTLEDAIDELESELSGGSRRKCIRVIPRDV